MTLYFTSVCASRVCSCVSNKKTKEEREREREIKPQCDPQQCSECTGLVSTTVTFQHFTVHLVLSSSSPQQGTALADYNFTHFTWWFTTAIMCISVSGYTTICFIVWLVIIRFDWQRQVLYTEYTMQKNPKRQEKNNSMWTLVWHSWLYSYILQFEVQVQKIKWKYLFENQEQRLRV